MRPTHVVEGNLLYSESTDLNVNLVPKILTFIATCALVFDHISGYHGLAKLTHKINHHIQKMQQCRPYPTSTHSDFLFLLGLCRKINS